MGVFEILFALFGEPSDALFLLLALGTVLLFVWRRVGVVLVTLGVVLLGLAGLSPLGEALMRPLEARYDPPADGAAPTGIVILGGYVSRNVARAAGDVPLNEWSERLFAAAVLAQRFPGTKIILTDGTADPTRPSGAETSAQVLTAMGIPADRLVLETRALSTYDNAVYSRDLVEPQPGETYYLVTSAWHLPRAVATFEAAGWPGIVPYPVDYLTTYRPAYRAFPGSVARGLTLVDTAAREYVATAAYWLAGRFDAPA